MSLISDPCHELCAQIVYVRDVNGRVMRRMRLGLGHDTVIHATCGVWVVSVRLSQNSRYLEVYICYTTKQKLSSHWCQYLWPLCLCRVIWNRCLSEIIRWNTCVFFLFGKWLMSKGHVWKRR